MIVSHICDNVKQCRYGVSHICYAVIMSDSNTPTDLTRKIGEILARKYDALEMSLRQAEDKTGLSRMTIKRMLNAETAIPLDKFETLARALGLIPWRVMRQAEDELEAQSNVLRFPATSRQENQPTDVIDFPHTQEENLPDFTKLAARKVTNRPEWDAIQALNDIGEESQDPGDYE